MTAMAQVKEHIQKWSPNPVEENGIVQQKTGQVRDPVFPELEVVPQDSSKEEEVRAPVCAPLPAVADELQVVEQKGGDVRGGGLSKPPAAAEVVHKADDVRISVSSRIAAIEKEVRIAANGGQSPGSFLTRFIPLGVQEESMVRNLSSEERTSPTSKLREENVEGKTGRQDRRSAAIPKDTGIAPNGAQHFGSVRTIFSALGAEQEVAVQDATSEQSIASTTKLPAEVEAFQTGGQDRGKGLAKLLPPAKTEKGTLQNMPGQERGNSVPATTKKQSEIVHKKESRGLAMKGAFEEDLETGSSTPARFPNKSLSLVRGTGQLRDAIAKGSPRNSNPVPAWASSTKLTTPTSPVPKKVVTPTKHGLKMKKATATLKEVKASSNLSASCESSPEIAIDYQRHKASSDLVSKSLDSANPGSCQVPVSPHAVAKSHDSPFFSNGGHDGASKVVDESILSPNFEDKDHNAAALKLDSKSFATGNNRGSETIKDQLEEDDNDEDKVALMCNTTTSIAETNRLSGDLGKLLGNVYGKLRWSSSGSETNTKPSARCRKSSSNQSIISKEGGVKQLQTSSRSSLGCSSSGGAQKFEIGSHTSLKLLQERCSIELNDSATVVSSRAIETGKKKTRDLGPHRHYYRGITMKLEQKLKS